MRRVSNSSSGYGSNSSGNGRRSARKGHRRPQQHGARHKMLLSPSFLLDALEGRTLLSTYSVTTTADSGAGSLRQAITDANASSDPTNLITFNITGAGVHTISLASALPAVMSTVTIDATTQPGYAGSPLVELTGGSSFTSVGLELDGAGDVVRGMSIYGFTDAAILLAGAGGQTVVGNWIGVGDGGFGLSRGVVVQSDNDLIGGSGASDRNVIAGNGDDGVVLNGGANDAIIGNYIGLDANGNQLRNNNNGVGIYGATGFMVRGNVISGNNADGIYVTGSMNAGGVIAGNIVGLDAAGDMRVANQADGVGIENSSNILVGGSGAADRNLIGGNFGDGVVLTDSSNVTIQGNWIGVDATGTQMFDANGEFFGNDNDGVHLRSSSFNQSALSAGDAVIDNVIAGSGGDGVHIELGVGSVATLVSGNYIGTNVFGNAPLGNDGSGVHTQSRGAIITGNVIGGNLRAGVRLEAAATVQGNFIGISADGSAAIGNTGVGVSVMTSGAVIGGVNAGQGNVIADNAGKGVVIAAGSGNSIRGNSIFANGGIGIDLGNDGVTPNGSTPANGANGGMASFPVVTSAAWNGYNVSVAGTFSGAAGATYYLDFYSSAAADPSGYGQGQVYLGSAAVTTDGSGMASFSLSFSGVGADQTVVCATATDASGNTSEFSMARTIAGNPPPVQHDTAVALVSSGDHSTLDQAVTFTATVTHPNGGNNAPTGTVQFFDGTTLLGSAPVAADGTAAFTVSSLSVGDHSITASYGGDARYFGSSSAAMTQTVSPNATAVVISSDGDHSTLGQAVTFTATVSHTLGNEVPTGIVQFFDFGVSLGSATVDGSGMASFTVSSLSVGDHSITASYVGDADYFGSDSAAITQHVDPNSTSLALVSSGDHSTLDQPVTFTATVSHVLGSGTPSGMVQFFDAGTLLGSAAVAADGTASLTVSTLSVGDHSITASYGGDGAYFGSDAAAITQSVSRNATSLALVSSGDHSTLDQAVTFTATVSHLLGNAAPSGMVQFFDGGALLGSAAVGTDGTASLTVSSLSVGDHSITASYGGDAAYFDSASGAITQSVSPNATTLALGSSGDHSAAGQAVTFTATVSHGAGNAAPTGMVQFFDGSTLLGSAAVGADRTASLTVSSLSVGDHSVTASYGGDAAYFGSSSAAMTESVRLNATTTSLAVSGGASHTFGDMITFTATVANNDAGGGVLDGDVSFYDNGVLIGDGMVANGVATFSTSQLAVGSHSIQAVYGGKASFAGSSSDAASVTVSNPTPPPPPPPANGKISGHTLRDKTGNGLSSDDKSLGGVTVKLFLDRNGNGVLDSADGAAVAKTVSASDGSYSFSALAYGTYFVQESAPSGFVRTAPADAYYTATVANAGDCFSGFDFDNYHSNGSDKGDVTNVSYTVTSAALTPSKNGSNGKNDSHKTDPHGQIHEGDTVAVKFTVLSGHTLTMSFVSYMALGPGSESRAARQCMVYDYQTGTYSPGTYTMTVHVPPCYFQLDFVSGFVIDRFGPPGSHVGYGAQDRLFASVNGGSHKPSPNLVPLHGLPAGYGA